MIDFDFDLSPWPEEATANAIVLKQKSKNRVMFDIKAEQKQLSAVLPDLPTKNDVYKMLSVKGGFASIGLINYVAQKAKIKHLYVSTFRIGLKQFEILQSLKKRGLINKATYITSGMQGENGLKYDYLTPILDGCRNNKWRITELNNHSKIILMETKKDFYVVETSSNLNENPKIEQFSFCNDEELFCWYRDFFEAVFENAE